MSVKARSDRDVTVSDWQLGCLVSATGEREAQ